MNTKSNYAVSRRSLPLASAGLALTTLRRPRSAQAAASRDIRITAASGRVPLAGVRHPRTNVRAYNGTVV
jgi:hypothetical protein